ncbi:MAG: hypothetical protein ACREPQ_04555 [Rhodanobacter sp.]
MRSLSSISPAAAWTACLHDIRGGWAAVHDPQSYGDSIKLARELRAADSNRHRGGECIAAFFPDVVALKQEHTAGR